MNFPDTITLLRATADDAYGNEAKDWSTAEEIPSRAYEAIPGHLLLLPRTSPVRAGDRYRIGDETYAGELGPIRSPSALKMYMIRLVRVED